jgi:hypothetical protein
MTPDHISRLLGGFATGTLSEAQRKLLFEAALEDQELFDELARDQELKELLEAPGVRQRLMADIAQSQPQADWQAGWWRHPLPWALGGAALSISAGLLALVYLTPSGSRPRPSRPTEVAQARPPAVEEGPSLQSDTGPSAQPSRKVQNEPKTIGSLRPPAPPSPAPAAGSSPGNAVSGNRAAPPPPPELQNEPRQIQVAPEAKAQQAAAEQAKAAAAPSPALPAAAPASPAPAPPAQASTSAARDVAVNGVVGGVPAPRALAARAPAAPPGRFAFDYSIHDGVLRIVPGSDGYLLVRAVVGPIDRLVLSTAHVVRGTPAELRVPDSATSMVVLFSARPVQEDSTDDLTARATSRTEQTGSVEDPRPSVNSRLEVRIVVSGK